MQNDKGEIVDMYIPRKCSATGRLIGSKDHASVQLNIGNVDANGKLNGTFTTYALSGFVRANSEADDSVNRLATQDGLMKAYLISLKAIDVLCRTWSYAK